MIDRNEAPLSKACRALGVSRSGYYKWKKKKPDPEKWIRPAIQAIALEFSKYGYRRITKELHRRGFIINHKRVLRIMREDNLLCIRRKFKPRTTDSNHACRRYPNLANSLEITGLNQLWVADITYVQLQQEFIYLAAVLDVGSRKCIGWELGRQIDTQLTLNAINMALKRRKRLGFSKLVHHSDQGLQYACKDYVERLQSKGIQISMSRKGNPYDNAFAESFMKTLKYEEVYIKEYETFDEAYTNIKRFIDQVYNRKRLHSGIGYKPPNEYERYVFS